MLTQDYQNKADLATHETKSPHQMRIEALADAVGHAVALGDVKAEKKARAELAAALEEADDREADSLVEEARERHGFSLGTAREVEELKRAHEDIKERWAACGGRIIGMLEELAEAWGEHEAIFYQNRKLDELAMVLRTRIRHHGLDPKEPEKFDMSRAMGVANGMLPPLKLIAARVGKGRHRFQEPRVSTGNNKPTTQRWNPEKNAAAMRRLDEDGSPRPPRRTAGAIASFLNRG